MQVTLDILFYKALMTIAVGGIGYIIMFPFRKAKAEFLSIKAAVLETKQELEQQRTNCLSTISQQGATQIQLLGKVADTLEGVRLDLKEQTGFIQGLTLSPRKRYAKK
jgi:hypothetical protein